MALRETAPKLSAEQYETNFADIAPPLSPRQAAIEAARCLYCFDAPCIHACPTRIDVPAFIKKIWTGNQRGAARVILDANILGESCGRVCPTEVLCEGACVMHEKGERAIEIGRLQRYAVDYVLDRNVQLFHAGSPNGRRGRLHRLRAGVAGLRRATGPVGLQRYDFRSQRNSWRLEHLRHRRLQTARCGRRCGKCRWCGNWASSSSRKPK